MERSRFCFDQEARPIDIVNENALSVAIELSELLFPRLYLEAR